MGTRSGQAGKARGVSHASDRAYKVPGALQGSKDTGPQTPGTHWDVQHKRNKRTRREGGRPQRQELKHKASQSRLPACPGCPVLPAGLRPELPGPQACDSGHSHPAAESWKISSQRGILAAETDSWDRFLPFHLQMHAKTHTHSSSHTHITPSLIHTIHTHIHPLTHSHYTQSYTTHTLIHKETHSYTCHVSSHIHTRNTYIFSHTYTH